MSYTSNKNQKVDEAIKDTISCILIIDSKNIFKLANESDGLIKDVQCSLE